jgi:hypothetical protein
MESRKSIDYYVMFSDLVSQHNQLTHRRNEIDREVTKLKQLILATFPLLPEDKQALFQAEIEEMEEQTGGLLNAVKLVFSAHKGEWLSPTQVRDLLTTMGFNLTQYRANPLASIGTTLRRMVPSQLESRTSGDGQVMYRRRLSLLDQMGRASLEEIKEQRMKLQREAQDVLRSKLKARID